ncbi:MAG: response regulator transcription factor [Acidimicrobiales bacterium]
MRTRSPTAAPHALALDGLRGHHTDRLDSWHRVTASRAAEPRLSPRELEVLRLLADGLTSDTIARRLGITTNTCRDHLKRLRSKLDCSTTLQVVVIAARLGLLPGLAPAHDRAE